MINRIYLAMTNNSYDGDLLFSGMWFSTCIAVFVLLQKCISENVQLLQDIPAETSGISAIYTFRHIFLIENK